LSDAGPDDRLGSRIHERFAALGGIDLPPRTEPPRAADFG
jgi:hypothetical protein